MAQLRNAITSRTGRVAMAAMLLLGVVTAVPVFSGAASAHHSNIDASVACDGTVSWTATSWSTGDEGTNPDILISTSVDGGGSTDIAHGAFNDANGYRFSGDFAWPSGATTVVVSSTPVGVWANGNTSTGGDSVTVTRPSNCNTNPQVGKVLECTSTAPGNGDGTVTLTLTNPAGPFGKDATFDVYDPDQTSTSTSHTVAAGETDTVVFSGLGDGSHSVKVVVGGTDLTQTFMVDCDSAVPSVTQSASCVAGTGSITVNLSNTGGDPVEFTVTDPITGQSETVAVEPNQSASRTFSGLADGQYVVGVAVGEMDLSQHFTVKCSKGDDHPADECDPRSAGGFEASGNHASSTTTTSPTTTTTTRPDPCHPGTPGDASIEVAKACADHDGQVTVSLKAIGGEEAIVFTVDGVPHSVAPNSTKDVVIGGLTDGRHTISVFAGDQDLSFVVDIACDLSPRVTITQQCVSFDGSVSLLLENLGDDVDATFTIDGVDHVLAPGSTETVVLDGLPDGDTVVTLSINGIEQDDIVVNFDCNPVFEVVAECNTVDTQGAVTTYWYSITNTEATDVEVTWDGGSTTVPAGATVIVGSASSPLSLSYDGVEIASATAGAAICSRDVTFDKELIGQPESPETYTISVSRLVGDAYVPVTTFDLVAGVPTTITLPSTLDPAGIQYVVDEISKGTASTSVVTPAALTLSGNLGETVSVVVTNGYASILLDKQTQTPVVKAGQNVSYTLQSANTGGLTLDPVVIYDRLPAEVSFVSATVDGDGGTCTLTQSARPQLVTCVMNDPVPAAGVTPVVTIIAKVDATVVANTTIVNQGKTLGSFAEGGTNVEPPASDLSCLPAVNGTVCALSAAVNVTITDPVIEPPTTTTPGTTPGTTPSTTPGTTTTIYKGPLPTTGGSSPSPLLAIGFGLSCVGGALVLSRRRLRHG